jgi:hypothetical protein
MNGARDRRLVLALSSLAALCLLAGGAPASADRGPQAAIEWFAAHPPGGAKLGYRTAGPHRSKVYRCLWFEWPDGRPLTGERP